MAKFLQETISESGLRAEKVVNSDEFKEFFRKVRPLLPGRPLEISARAQLILDSRSSLSSSHLNRNRWWIGPIDRRKGFLGGRHPRGQALPG